MAKHNDQRFIVKEFPPTEVTGVTKEAWYSLYDTKIDEFFGDQEQDTSRLQAIAYTLNQEPISSKQYKFKLGEVCPQCRSDKVMNDIYRNNGKYCDECGSSWDDVVAVVGYVNLRVGG